MIFSLWLAWPPNFKALQTGDPGPTRLMALRRQQAASHHRTYTVVQKWVPLNRISPHLTHAVIAAEDDTFYRHHGIDWSAAWLSLRHDVRRGRFARGGSTITQQVVKNLYLSPRKSLLRKLKEAVLALQIEQALEKRRILEIYLNIAEWGRGIYGAEAAARAYFGKAAADLTAEEAVALVAVLPSPLRHSPVNEDRYLAWRRPWIWRQLSYAGYGPVTAPAESARPEEPAPGEEPAGAEAWDDPGEGELSAGEVPIGVQTELSVPDVTAGPPDAVSATPTAQAVQD